MLCYVFAIDVDVLLVVVLPLDGDVALFEEVGEVFFVGGEGLFCVWRKALQDPVGECAVQCACGESDSVEALCEDLCDGGFASACLPVNCDDPGAVSGWGHGLGFVGWRFLVGMGAWIASARIGFWGAVKRIPMVHVQWWVWIRIAQASPASPR